uniref:Uncharacterized protein LOC117349578 n=1 Tax=Geotrypetes seraphini TaxID=260995 RepID=A0A6P8P5V2_GEOSA|nr:uncharacterized protein LOC117349578 [Geotrypetes seraphini]
MTLDRRWRIIRKTVMMSGMAMIVIGVVLVAFSNRIMPFGIFFLVAGSVGVLAYFLSILVKYFKTPTARAAGNTEEQATERSSQTQQQERNQSIYNVPAYEEVVSPDFRPPLGIWIISPTPYTPSLADPPPYSVVANEPIESNSQETAPAYPNSPAGTDSNEVTAVHGGTSNSNLPLHKLQRFMSDIHEVNGVQEVPVHLEPLTPPPIYQNPLEDVVFEEDFQAAL